MQEDVLAHSQGKIVRPDGKESLLHICLFYLAIFCRSLMSADKSFAETSVKLSLGVFFSLGRVNRAAPLEQG